MFRAYMPIDSISDNINYMIWNKISVSNLKLGFQTSRFEKQGLISKHENAHGGV